MGIIINEKPGTVYGDFTIIKLHRIDWHHDAYWFVRCSHCGKIHSVRGWTLRNGKTRKCNKGMVVYEFI